MLSYTKNCQKEGGGMSIFIQNNIVWLVPVASILLTVVIKIAAKPEFMTLGFTDYLDFGFDLSITSMIVLLTGIKGENDAGIWLLFLSFLSSLNKSIHKHNKLNGLSTLHKTPLPLKNGAVFLYGFWSP